MPFVKLDCGILDSTLWIDRHARDVFITALLMAEPYELEHQTEQLSVRSLEKTGWIIPPGWYGFVGAAGVGIIHRAQINSDDGMSALERLGEPEVGSRSHAFDGRRLVRVDGGFIVLNYMAYRDRDYTTADRSRRYRERLRKKGVVEPESRRGVTQSPRDITQAEAEAEVEKKNKKRAAASPRDSMKVMTKLAHELIVTSETPNFADLKDSLKAACAKHHITYDSEIAGAALESALAQRPW